MPRKSATTTIISQSQAKRMRRQLAAIQGSLSKLRHGWAEDWPDVTSIGYIKVDPVNMVAVKTARQLGHVVFVVPSGAGELILYADRVSVDTSKK